ncbi:helix-turn-helix domain-containing protein [Rhodanobacter sp. C05]|uniref:helix-turn-helix domain-containing protein n=1 Tax=Rhodanobacter sp. C05 TaxID=1945855 RepID=UPI00117BC0D4|nr:helix-turn-helix domain-containing protein [Rhodanobacter sp. C05]
MLIFGSTQIRVSLYLAAYFACLAVDSVVGMALGGWRDVLPVEAVRWLHAVNVPLAYLLGPLLYGYAVALTSLPSSRHGRKLWHIVPYACVLLVSAGNAVAAFDRWPAGMSLVRFVYSAWVLQGMIYLVLAVHRTYQARPLLEQAHADEVALRLTWLRRLLALVGIIWALVAIDRIPIVTGMEESAWFGPVPGCATTVTLCVLAWFGLRQRVLVPPDFVEPTAADPESHAAAYARSGVDPVQCAQIADELRRLMRSEHLYADSHFDLQALSERSGWSPNYISQALNQGLGQNFFEFVNGFRVAAAESCLADPTDKRTILEVALACGFGSKSTFNAVFKRMTDRTPSQYRRSHPAFPDESPA